MFRKSFSIVLSFAFALSFLLATYSPVARAQNEYEWTATEELLMHTEQLSDQYRSKAAFSPVDNRYLVVWEDNRNGNSDIYGRLVNDDGSLIGDADIQITQDSSDQKYPAIAYDSSNNRFFVVWNDLRSGNGDVYGVFIDAAGHQGNEIRLTSSVAFASGNTDVKYSPISRRFLVVWTDLRIGNAVIYGRFINSDASLYQEDFQLSTRWVAGVDASDPKIAFSSSNNRFLVVWQVNAWKYGMFLIGGKLIDASSGAVIYAWTTMSLTSRDYQPEVAYDSLNNRFLLVWASNWGSWDWSRIYGRFIEMNGSLSSRMIFDSGNSIDPDIAFDPVSNRFLIVWSISHYYGPFPLPQDCYGKMFDSSGNPISESMPIIASQYWDPSSSVPNVIFNSNEKNFFVTYSDYRNGWDVYGTALTPGNIDKSSPMTSILITGDLGQNGWYISDVSVTLSATDNEGGSGVAKTQYSLDGGANWLTYSAPILITSEGTTTLLYRSSDNAGNVEDTKSLIVKIDKSAPVISINSPRGTTYLHSDILALDYSATDSVSGVASTIAKLDGVRVTSGSVDLLNYAPGQHTFTVTSTDNAGNSSEKSVTFQIVVSSSSLDTTVEKLLSLGLIDQKVVIPAEAKIDAAGAAIISGQNNTAINILNAFINYVQAQTGKAITPSAAELLIGDARYLIGTL